MKLKLAIAGVVLALGLAVPASAHSYGPGYGYGGWHTWQLLGTREVQHFGERDTIFTPGFQQYRQVKLCAYRRPVRLYDLDVVFRNGGHQDVRVRRILNPGECTRSIDLYGHRRDVQLVSLAYETIGYPRGPRAVVQVYAR